MISFLFTCFGLLSKCFRSVKIKSAASLMSLFKFILSNCNLSTIFLNLEEKIELLNWWATCVVKDNACPCENPSLENTYDNAWPKVVDEFPNPNPVIKEPNARLSYFFSKMAFSNISKAVLHRNLVFYINQQP